MNIIGIRLAMLRLPLRTPFRTALRTVEQLEDIVVQVQVDSGHWGYGEAPPTAAITGETHASLMEAINGYIAPAIMGRSIDDIDSLSRMVQHAMARNSSAKAAVEMALYDLHAQMHGVPLHELLGGSTTSLMTDLTISVGAIDKMVADTRDALARGFTALKIKLGRELELDVERVQAIHETAKGRASLRLDANQGWTARHTVDVLHALERAGIVPELIEQPVPAYDLDGMRYVIERVQTPVMADESVFGPEDVQRLLREKAADIVNIKLMKAGGIARALRIADIAADHGVPCMMGCMLESGISVAAAAHVAAARPDTIRLIDLDGPQLCAIDPVRGGVRFHGPHIDLSRSPGLGIDHVERLQWF
ncbi:dipeptide epimerase [Dyella sp.]|uniref:dipeptide epimerase n=1 Tax=Dyella sp. TaxID=1869338 RepID=UPI002ED380D7